MLTPQEVQERVFPKARKGGYDMQDVDTFLDELTEDYSELYKENAVLKRKMKVLADKITEYQETEGAMRATLLAAQKMSTEMVEEAKTKRKQMLEEAENIVRARTANIAQQVADEQEKLRSAKASVAEMLSGIREILTHEQEFLASLPEYEAEQEPEEETEDVADAVATEIGESISRMLSEEKAEEEEAQEAPAEEAEEETPAEEETQEEAPAEEAEEDEAPTRRMDLSELRFGRNYEIK